MKESFSQETLEVRYAWRPTSIVLGLALLLLILTHSSARAEEKLQKDVLQRNEFRIVIHCGLNLLQLWRNAELLREYPIETGKGGLGKQRSGDHCTPLGNYEVSWMASRNSSKGHKIIDNKSWCTGNKFVYSSSGSSIEKLWAESYGGDEATVISINYPNAKDRQKGFTGECIHIHADKKIQDGMLRKSYGCIHMFPKNAMELYELVTVGTPVKILP